MKVQLSNPFKRFLTKAILCASFLLLLQSNTTTAQPYASLDYYYDSSRSNYYNSTDYYNIYTGVVTFYADAARTIPWSGALPSSINIRAYQAFHCQSASPYGGSSAIAVSPDVFTTDPFSYYADKLVQPSWNYPGYSLDRIFWLIEPGDGYLIADGQTGAGDCTN